MLKCPTYLGSLNPIALNADEQAMYWNKARRSNCNFQTMASSSYFNPRLKLNHWPLLKWENPNMITYFMTGAWSASSGWSRITKMSCDHNTFTPQCHPFLFLITFTFIRCIHFFLTLFFPPPLTLLPRNNFLVGIFQFLSHRHSMDRPLLISRLPRSAIPETTFPFLISYFFLSVLPSCSSGSPCNNFLVRFFQFLTSTDLLTASRTLCAFCLSC